MTTSAEEDERYVRRLERGGVITGLAGIVIALFAFLNAERGVAELFTWFGLALIFIAAVCLVAARAQRSKMKN